MLLVALHELVLRLLVALHVSHEFACLLLVLLNLLMRSTLFMLLTIFVLFLAHVHINFFVVLVF